MVTAARDSLCSRAPRMRCLNVAAPIASVSATSTQKVPSRLAVHRQEIRGAQEAADEAPDSLACQRS